MGTAVTASLACEAFVAATDIPSFSATCAAASLVASLTALAAVEFVNIFFC
jgi:hypothetical protein